MYRSRIERAFWGLLFIFLEGGRVWIRAKVREVGGDYDAGLAGG
jgi:hypothetical protein